LLATWLGKKIFKKEKFIWPKLTGAIFAFILTAAFSLILSFPYRQNRELKIAGLYLLRWIVYSGIYFVLRDLSKEKVPNFDIRISNLLIASGIVAAILGLAQYVFLPDIRSLAINHWDPHYYRVVGTYLDPGYTGMIYVLTLILIIIKLGKKNMTNCSLANNLSMKKFGLVIWGILTYVALALTYARSAYLAYLIGMGVIAWYKKSVKFFFTVLLIGVLTVFLLPRPGGEGVKLERQSTIWARINNWRQSLQVGFDHPLFGAGFNTYRYVQRDYGFLDQKNWQKTHAGAGADSSLLFLFATTGVAGLMSYIYLMVKIFNLGLRNKSPVIVSSLMALLGHSFFNNSLFYAWIIIWGWMLLAIGLKSEV